MCTFDIFSSSSYTYCLFHLGAISPSYFSQITDVIAQRFVLVPLQAVGKGKENIPGIFTPCCLSCSAFSVIVRIHLYIYIC